MTLATEIEVDVLVVGYGPTGAVLATRLAASGHDVMVIDRWPHPYGLPRLTHIDGETARIIQACGDVDEALREATAVATYPFVDACGAPIATFDLADPVAGRAMTPPGTEWSGYALHYSMYQPHIEQAIDDRLSGLPTALVRRGVELLDFVDDGRAVAARLSDGTTVRSRYLVGCDGANGTVRERAGIARLDLGFNERWLNIDTEVLHPLDGRLPDVVQVCDPAAPRMTMQIGATRRRFEFHIADSTLPDDALVEPSLAWALLERHFAVSAADVRIARQIPYRFSARIAERWRQGRVLLAGDAAHTMPPYMGQGACMGMRDALDLAWRLDLVLSGTSPGNLLGGYAAGRRPQAEAIARQAIAMGRLANIVDPGEAAIVHDLLRRGQLPAPPPFPEVSGGFLASARFNSARLRGTLGPQGRIAVAGAEGRADDVLGVRFTLIAAHSTDLDATTRADLDAIGGALCCLDDPAVTFLDGTYRRYLATQDIHAALVRPDFVVYGTASSRADVGALVAAARRHLGAPQVFDVAVGVDRDEQEQPTQQHKEQADAIPRSS